MPLVRDDAVILQTHVYSETSKILRLLTPEHGVVSVIARGALRARSRYGGVLEPFTYGVATYYFKDGRELQTLSEFELTRSGQGLGRDLIRFGASSLLVELILRTVGQQADRLLYDQLCSALDRLDSAPPENLECIALSEAWRLTARLGFEPTLDVCAHCNAALVPEEDALFDFAGGGAACGDCAPAGAPELPATARRTLARICNGDNVSIARTRGYWTVLSRFLTYHVLEGATLKSLRFLSDNIEG